MFIDHPVFHTWQHRAPAGIIEFHPLASRLQVDHLSSVLADELQLVPQSFLGLWVVEECSDPISEQDCVESKLVWQ